MAVNGRKLLNIDYFFLYFYLDVFFFQATLVCVGLRLKKITNSQE